MARVLLSPARAWTAAGNVGGLRRARLTGQPKGSNIDDNLAWNEQFAVNKYGYDLTSSGMRAPQPVRAGLYDQGTRYAAAVSLPVELSVPEHNGGRTCTSRASWPAAHGYIWACQQRLRVGARNYLVRTRIAGVAVGSAVVLSECQLSQRVPATTASLGAVAACAKRLAAAQKKAAAALFGNSVYALRMPRAHSYDWPMTDCPGLPCSKELSLGEWYPWVFGTYDGQNGSIEVSLNDALNIDFTVNSRPEASITHYLTYRAAYFWSPSHSDPVSLGAVWAPAASVTATAVSDAVVRFSWATSPGTLGYTVARDVADTSAASTVYDSRIIATDGWEDLGGVLGHAFVFSVQVCDTWSRCSSVAASGTTGHLELVDHGLWPTGYCPRSDAHRMDIRMSGYPPNTPIWVTTGSDSYGRFDDIWFQYTTDSQGAFYGEAVDSNGGSRCYLPGISFYATDGIRESSRVGL